MVTLEDIEKEVAGSSAIKFATNRVMTELRKAVKYFVAKYDEENGTRLCKDLILGKRSLDEFEKRAASKKFGAEIKAPLEMLAKLNLAQKQYIFKQMGWDIGEVK